MKPKEDTMFKTPLSLFKKCEIGSLREQHTLLNLLHARNRNQHRRSIWYRHFSTFKRELGKLCADLEVCISGQLQDVLIRESISSETTARASERRGPVTTHAERIRATTQARPIVTARLVFWVDADMAVKWYVAFTQLIRDTQFSALGLTLLGVLGRVCSVTGLTAWMRVRANEMEMEEEERAEKGLYKALERFAETDARELFDGEDLGVAIGREEVFASSGLDVQGPGVKDVQDEGEHKQRGKERKKKSVREKPKNDIDAIFGL